MVVVRVAVSLLKVNSDGGPLVDQAMIKTALSKGDLQIELRCERSNLFDLNKKHADIHRLFYGESINVQVIFRHEGIDLAGLEDKIKVSLEDVHLQKQLKSSSYTKLGASMMKIKSVESLTDTHMSPHASLMASMDSLVPLVGRHGDQSVLYQDESTLVLSIPMIIPDLLDDEDLDVHAPVKHIQFTVSVYEYSEKATLLDALADKSLRPASRQLGALLAQSEAIDEPVLILVQNMKKSLELVNPVDASLSIVRCGPSIMLVTELSPTDAFDAENPLYIDSFELSFVSDHARKLLGRFLQIAKFPGDQTEYPIELRNGETFSFCHVVKVFQGTDLTSIVQDLCVQACIIGKYMNKDIKLDLELPVEIAELTKQEKPQQSVTVECPSAPMHVTLGEPFAIEFVIRNHEFPVNDGRDLTAEFPVNQKQGLIALESEVTLGTLLPGEIRTISVKYLSLKEGRHIINDIRVVDYSDGSEYTPSKPIETYVYPATQENKVSRFSPSSWFKFGAPEKSDTESTEANLLNDNDLRRGVLFFHYGGLEGLPSFDPECLKFHMLLRLAHVPYREEITKEVLMSPSGELPFVMTVEGRCSSGAHLQDLLLNRLIVADHEYTDQHRHLQSSVKDLIRPVLMSAIWSEPAIYEYILKPLYKPSYCKAVRELLLWKKHRSMTSLNISDRSVLDNFHQALNKAAEKLGDAKYFGGEKPGLLDALIGPDLLLIPFYLPASHRLHQEFSHHHNLYDYSIHMLEYFRHQR